MREYSTPLTIDIPTNGNLTDDVVTNATKQPDLASFSRKTDDGWKDVTAAEFLEEIRGVAGGLVAAGIAEGDRVAILSKTRYEWTVVDYAIWFAGGVTVPIYESSSAEQIQWILSDSGTVAAVVESDVHLARLAEVRADVPTLAHVWCFEDGAVEQITSLGQDVEEVEVERRRTALTPESLATIIYTSGTTGRPKGCMLTHGNFMFELGVEVHMQRSVFCVPGTSGLLFLPLAHVLARIIPIGMIKAQAKLGHSAPDVPSLLANFATFKPTFILAVPRLFENIFNRTSQKAASEGKGRIFDMATDAAIAYSRALDSGGPRIGLRLKHAIFDRLVYRKLRDALGGRCGYAISGGAPLGERLGHFYRGIGLVVLEGYGLTETTAAVTSNTPETCKIGTVGRPVEGTTIRVAEDGELLVKGGQVFAGYWNNEAATRDTFTSDGWFCTGDLGEIDDEGFVRITGRKKEILVTAGGKNVAPNVLEDRLRAHYLVSQCMVVGDGQPFIAALITIDAEAFPTWAEQHGKTGSLSNLTDDPDLLAEMEQAVEEANKAVSRAESIRKFSILPMEWSEEAGHITPSLKLKRNVVMREFRADVEALYSK